MNRRMFLFSTLSAPLTLGADEARIKVAFLGGSHSHAQEKVKVVQGSPRYELAGLWEEDPKLRAQYQNAGVPVKSMQEILKDPSIRVIAVESAVQDHAAHARMVLEAGKHVHVEKPPADNLDSFRSLVALAERKRLLMQMGYMWRFNPAINTAVEAARKGWLGKIYLVRGMMNTLIAGERRPEWALLQGGQMFEQGSHLIDPMVRLMGAPEKVTPFLKKHGQFEDKLKDNTVAVFEWAGALGILTSSTLQPGAGSYRSLEILGTNGTATVRPIEPPTLQVDLAQGAGPYRAKSQTVSLAPYRRYVGDFEELSEAIRLQKPLSITPQEDLLVHETLMRACLM